MSHVEQNYHYYAFISYSHKDARWAKWIHNALEHYRLPSVMRKAEKAGYPKKIAPVFLDATDLGAGNLAKTLPEELAKSRYLIVLCSPNSACPNEQGKNYIDQEIRWFCGEDRDDNMPSREDYVIPVIIEGSPQEAFCQSLKKREILAVDATKQSKARVLNDIVAKILGLKPDELWKRELRRRRETRAIYSGLLTFLALSFMGLASVFKDRYCDYVKYYSDYINEWGIPQGVGELTKADKEHRSRFYKFTYRGYVSQENDKMQRVLRSVCYCDASGYVVDDAPCIWVSRPPQQNFYYEDGKLIRKTAIDKNGMEMYSLNISEEGIWSKSSNNPHDPDWVWGGTVAGYEDVLNGLGLPLNAAAYLPELRTLATIPSFFVSERNESGLPTRIDFLPNNQSRTAMPNGLGAYGEKYSYDNLGRLKGVRFLDKNGNPLSVTNVFAGLDVDYNGLTTTVVSIDVQGHPIANTFGWVSKQYIYSSLGNLIEVCFRDESMNLDNGPQGIAVVRTEYDDSGRFEKRHLRYNSKGALVSDEVGWAIREMTHRGNYLDIYYKKANGEEYITEDGYSHIAIEHTQGQRQERYFLADNVPARHAKSLAHKHVSKYYRSANGEKTVFVKSWYDENQNPFICRDVGLGSVSNVVYCFNRYGMEEMRLLPADGTICASIKCERTMKFGRVVRSRLTFRDAEGKPTIPKPVESFDLQSLQMSKQHDELLKAAEIPQPICEEIDGVEIFLDEMGRIERIVNLRNGEMAETTYGSSQTQISYGENGLISRFALKDKEGMVTTNVLGISVMDLRYDERGLSDGLFLSKDEKPMLVKAFGASRCSWEYDRYGHVSWIRRYGTNDTLVSNIDGCAVSHQEYTPQGQPLMVEFFDENMNRVAKKGTSVYVARYSYQRYDEGTIQCERFFGADGCTPMKSPELGYHMLKHMVNMRGQLIEQATYDVDCKTLVSDRNGVARMVCKYNSLGSPESVRKYDSRNKLIVEIVDVNGKPRVPLRVFSNTRVRWGLQDNDIIVAVDGTFCLGNEGLTMTMLSNTFERVTVPLKVTVARFNSLLQFFELKDAVLPVDDDNIPAGVDLHFAPLEVFLAISNKAKYYFDVPQMDLEGLFGRKGLQ